MPLFKAKKYWIFDQCGPRMMRDNYLFGEQPTIHDVVAHQKKKVQQVMEELSAQEILTSSPEVLTADIVERFRLDVPVIDRTSITQIPNEEVDIDVSHDFRRVFRTPGPHYVKGTALRIRIPFKGEAALFRYGISPFNNPIPGEIGDNTIILTYSAEHPDASVARAEFDNRLGRIENTLQMVRGPAHEWNRQLPALVSSRLQERRDKLDRDKGLTLEYPPTPPAPVKLTAQREQRVRVRPPQPYNLFLSHASEDKEAIARPLYTALVTANVSVWFDEAVLELGDSLRQKIDEGLARCRYGIVILSPRFLSKQWPQRELDGLVARETASGEKAILPIWHELDRNLLLQYSPTLADRIAGRSEEGVSALVEKILRVLRK